MVVVWIRVKKRGGKIDHNTRGYTLLLVLIVLFMWLRHIVIASSGCSIGPC